MKIIWVDNETQDNDTENPQLINGVHYSWKVHSRKLRHKELRKELEDPHYKDCDYLLIHDVISIHSHFCDQGCTPGMGCKTKYSETSHALILRYFKIYDSKIGKRNRN